MFLPEQIIHWCLKTGRQQYLFIHLWRGWEYCTLFSSPSWCFSFLDKQKNSLTNLNLNVIGLGFFFKLKCKRKLFQCIDLYLMNSINLNNNGVLPLDGLFLTKALRLNYKYSFSIDISLKNCNSEMMQQKN